MKYRITRLVALPCALLFMSLTGCGASTPPIPYPAFIDVNALDNVFLAGLPGARAKQLAGDPRSRRSSNRVMLPESWQFTTGASPIQSVEIFVLAGEIQLGEFALGPGGYAHLPAGTSGFQMASEAGAYILYFLDATDDAAVIETPLIASSDLLEWESAGVGLMIKELRFDPGSGARTWLLKVEPEAVRQWQRSSQVLEGYLLSGTLTESECVFGTVVTDEYRTGGYFYRSAGALSGGPESVATSEAVWFLRVPGYDQIEALPDCVLVPQ